MVPADESLDANDSTGGEVADRLEVREELATFKGVTELELDVLQARPVFDERRDPLLAGAARVERLTGPPEQAASNAPRAKPRQAIRTLCIWFLQFIERRAPRPVPSHRPPKSSGAA